MSNPYGYGSRPSNQPGPPPGVLPPPQAAPYPPGRQGPYQSPPPGQYPGGPYPGQWGPQYGGGAPFNGFQPQRKRGSGLRLFLLGFMGIMVIGTLAAVLAVLLTGKGSDETAAGPPAPPGPTIVPTPTTNPQKGSAEDFLLNAPIYSSGALPEQDCKAAPLGNGSLAAQKVYYQKLFKCLNDAWRPIFAKIGKGDTPDPGLVVFDKPVDTPCGNFKPLSGRVLAFYCYGNNFMYTDVAQMNKAFGPKEDLAYLMVIAHEYGHHVQGVSGMFSARQAYLMEHPDMKLESSRRNELQASCFAGVFSKAVASSYPLTERMGEFRDQSSSSFGESPSTPEDERTHGLATSQGFWIQNGFNIGENKACNTHAAQGDLVR